MRSRHLSFLVLFCCAVLLSSPLPAAAEKVDFQPVRTPSMGPENAKVTVYEIADFM
ncbi:MAG: hypothetical protein JSV26_06905 [bacterium]|nr:MAG: hypothetical protein JSV26_06905 [bacterium]